MEFLNIQLQSFILKGDNNGMNSIANSRLVEVLLNMNIAFHSTFQYFHQLRLCHCLLLLRRKIKEQSFVQGGGHSGQQQYHVVLMSTS